MVEQRWRGFCPQKECGQLVECRVTRVAGGVNDIGHVLATCSRCDGPFSILGVANPHEALIAGATVTQAMEDFNGETSGEAELPPAWLDPILFEPANLSPRDHDANTINLFRCDKCGNGVEKVVQDSLGDSLDTINQNIDVIYHQYQKGSIGSPSFTVVRRQANCCCGMPLDVVAYGEFRPNEPLFDSPKAFLIAGVVGAENFDVVDGIFSRDDCETLLRKLMARWRLLFPSTVLATPFVGFSFGGRSRRFMETWERLLSMVDPDSVTLVTRKRTITDFKKASAEDGIDFELLHRYGLLHPALTSYVKESRFHAKFYAAVDADAGEVEVLIGSFNFQDGSAPENITLRRYNAGQFRSRYLDPLGVPAQLPARDLPLCITIDLRSNHVRPTAGRFRR